MFTLRPTLEGPAITGWHELTGNEGENSAVWSLMKVGARANGYPGPYLVNSETDEWNIRLMQNYLRSLSHAKLKEFCNSALTYVVQRSSA